MPAMSLEFWSCGIDTHNFKLENELDGFLEILILISLEVWRYRS